MERQEFRKHRRGILKRLANRLFPDRQILLRTEGRVSYLQIPRWAQVFTVLLVAAMGAWTAFTSVSYFVHERIFDAKDNQIANARLRHHVVIGELAEYSGKYSAIVRDLEENHRVMLGLLKRNTALKQDLATVENQLETTKADRSTVVDAREGLKRQLAEIQNQIESLATHNYALRGNLDNVETGLQSALAERNRALFEGNRMRNHISMLENRLVSLEETQHDAVQRLTDRTVAKIDGIAKVIGLTGLKAESFLAADDTISSGQGGPFIEAGADGIAGGGLKADLANLNTRLEHWKALEKVMRRLPLTSPLNYYSITSRFGKRRDPINKKWASHYGIDMGAVFRSSVYVTAPGKVTYAGWKGKYGRMIEVDHGAGLKTRYGHLHRALVKKGQMVDFREKIALVGSTGRSTGAHLHYEIVFKGRPRNPTKFIKAGRHVFQD